MGSMAWKRRSAPLPSASAHFAAVGVGLQRGNGPPAFAFPHLVPLLARNLYRQEDVNAAYNHLMRHAAAALLKEALTLPADDRADLAQALLASLDNHVDEHAQDAWKEQIDVRIAEFDAAMLSTSPSSVLRQRLIGYRRERALRRLRASLILAWSPPATRGEIHRR
jgi:putative addiction module component (TIGR02574 family)